MKRKVELKEELNRQLHVVQDELGECLEQFGLRMQARLSEMIEVLEAEGVVRGRRKPTVRELRRLTEGLRELRVKPRKGRMKDLRQLGRLVDEAWEAFSEERG